MSIILEQPNRVTAANLHELVIAAVSQSTFYQKANPLVKQAVKGNYDFEDIDVDSELYGFTDGTEDVQYGDDVTYKQHTGSVCGFRVSSLIKHTAFINTMQEQGYAPGVHAELITQTDAWPAIENLFIRKTRKKWSRVALYGDTEYGSGDETLCDGLFKKFLAREGNNTVDADTDAIDNDDPFSGDPSVVTEMRKLVAEMPDDSAFEGEPEEGTPVIFVSTYIWRQYGNWQENNNSRGGTTPDVTKGQTNYFKGYEVRLLVCLKKYEMYFTHESNIMVIFDSESDMTSLSLVDQYEITRKKQVSLDCMFRAAVDVRDARRMVYYY